MKCKHCGNEVEPTKNFSWGIFILLLILAGIPGMLYLVYYWTKSAKTCPVCDNNVYK
ncbi:MAG: hypothetical protein ACQEQD_04530 [Bacillota bacterium]